MSAVNRTYKRHATAVDRCGAMSPTTITYDPGSPAARELTHLEFSTRIFAVGPMFRAARASLHS